MSSSSASFLKIPVSEFIDFLNGKTVSDYPDTGETLIRALSSFLSSSLRQQSGEFLHMKSLQPSQEIIGDMDIIDFLINVFPKYTDVNKPSPIQNALDSISQPSGDVLLGWLFHYLDSELKPLQNSSRQAPLFGIFSQSSVHMLLYSLLEDASQFYLAIDDEYVVRRLTEIKDAILSDLMKYLGRLSIAEAFEQDQKQRDLKSSPSGPQIVAGGQRQRDNTRLDIEHDEWFLAWEDEFRGSALQNLEVKLSLNVQALQAKREDKIDMSRIIPIVQSSGTGKSRLAEQYVKENFGVFLGLKNGHGYPPHDAYVYKYFKNLLRLDVRGWDTPDDPLDLSGFDDVDQKEYQQRHNDASYTVNEETSVYTIKWRYERAKGNSVPKGWAAVGRLRVACFVAGFFRTMVSYMETKDYTTVQNWRNNLLHTDSTDPGPARDQFWYDVIKNSLAILKKSDYQRKWWEDYEKRTNANIKTSLMLILEPEITAFLGHPITKACLSEIRKNLPFLLIIDEAAYLYQTNYMHSFMWVLDEPVVGVLSKWRHHYPQANRFFILMLGTHSQISHFAPDYIYPSERVFSGTQSHPSVFLSLDWDSGVKLPERFIRFDQTGCIENLVMWGRPMWLSFYNGLDRIKTMGKTYNDAYILQKTIRYAVKKLREPDMSRFHLNQISEESSLTIFAILAIRLHLDLDFAAPSRASKLVTSRLRWLIDVDNHHKYLITTYGSEPIVAEAAAYLLNTPRERDDSKSQIIHPWICPLVNLEEQLSHGYVSKGAHGELTARLLLIMAKDQVTRESWQKDKTFLSHVSKLEGTEIKRRSFTNKSTKYYFKEAKLYYGGPPDGFAFFHRAVKVKDFLRGFLSDVVFSELESHFKNTKKWESLDNAYVNFTHWAPVMGDDSSHAFTKEGFFANWIRHKAYFLGKSNFKAIDLVIPMVFLKRGQNTIDLDSMAFLAISVKNKSSGSELKQQTYLSTNEVEGVCGEDGKVKPGSKSSNLKLTLHSLAFINPSTNIISDESLVNHWVKTSADKPYIAFSMSMGDTTDTSQLFIAEESTQRSEHRIVFGLRGFLNTYRFPDPLIQETLESILIRHDASGRYPTSAPDYHHEEVLLRAARKPLDEPEDILRRWFPATPINPSTPIDSSDVDMSDGQESEEEEHEDENGELDNSSDVQRMDVAQ